MENRIILMFLLFSYIFNKLILRRMKALLTYRYLTGIEKLIKTHGY
jgi:hypothetical protein